MLSQNVARDVIRIVGGGSLIADARERIPANEDFPAIASGRCASHTTTSSSIKPFFFLFVSSSVKLSYRMVRVQNDRFLSRVNLRSSFIPFYFRIRARKYSYGAFEIWKRPVVTFFRMIRCRARYSRVTDLQHGTGAASGIPNRNVS